MSVRHVPAMVQLTCNVCGAVGQMRQVDWEQSAGRDGWLHLFAETSGHEGYHKLRHSLLLCRDCRDVAGKCQRMKLQLNQAEQRIAELEGRLSDAHKRLSRADGSHSE